MKKSILYIELCNFENYPLGGHLSFALHLTTAMHGDIDLAGYRTDNSLSEGNWHKVIVSGSSYNYYNVKNIHISPKKPLIPARIRDYFRIKRHICDILSHKEYDIIIVQTPEVLFSLPEKYLGRVCLISPGVSNPLSISRYAFARKFGGIYDKFFFKRASKVNIILPAADSNAINKYIERSHGVLKSTQIVQFPTRYDAEIFYPSSKIEIRKSLGLQKDALIFVTTGRLNWVKGWQFLIDAFNLFCTTHDNSLLLFIGKGEDEQAIRSHSEGLGLKDKVILVGSHPLTTVSLYINAADLFVMGSFSEGWSTSLVEAIACAKPCVVTNFSSANDLVTNDVNGYVVTERDESVFAAAMEKALYLHEPALLECAEKASTMSVQCMREQLDNILKFE